MQMLGSFSSAETERRMAGLEAAYDAAHADPANAARLEELRFQIAGLIGRNNLHILREYTDRLIVQYNKDCDWFYQEGQEDARHDLPAHR